MSPFSAAARGLHRRHPRRPARRERRLHREGAGARRHVPPRRLHPDEGLGADRLALKEAEESFAKLGVTSASRQLDFAAGERVEGGVVKQMTRGVAGLFKANGVEWVKGTGTFKDGTRSRSKAGRTSRSSPRSSRPARFRCARRSTGSTRRSASTRRPARAGRLSRSGSSSSAAGSSAASSPRSSSRFGSEVTIVEMLAR